MRQDPILTTRKLIAEPWDLGPEGYQLGMFQSPWREWNGRYRDEVRMFWTGESPHLSTLATRLSGSSDLFPRRRPSASINFITAHDGFTLRDLVTYEQKHNHANGEGNRDGHEPNHSRNWGIEGPTDDPHVQARRRAVRRSLMATLMLSQGVPMILGGDEIGRTQGGNNNAYCQDNEVSWHDWAHVDEAFVEQVRALIAFRREHPLLSQRRFLGHPGSASATWWHASGRPMQEADWHNPHERILGLQLLSPDASESLFLAINPLDHPVVFAVPTDYSWDVAGPFADLARIESGLLHLDGLSTAALIPADR